MFFPSGIANFIPYLDLIPLGIAVLPEKKTQMYRPGTYQVDENSYPINRLVNTKNQSESHLEIASYATSSTCGNYT